MSENRKFAGHTPAEWATVSCASKVDIFAGGGQLIATVESDGCESPEEMKANAELIAAAPKLLAERDRLFEAYKVLKELQECSRYWSEYDVPIGIHERIDAAIAGVEELQEVTE